MKKRPTSGKAKSATGWHKHLDKQEQRRANRGTRQIEKREDEETVRERDEPDYDAPRPLSALENWQRNDEHNVP